MDWKERLKELSSECGLMDKEVSMIINQEYGYALVTQVNGVTDINESRLYKLELEDGEYEWEESVDQS